MAYRLEIVELIEMGSKLWRGDSVTRRHKGHAPGHTGVDVARPHIHFHAITCGEDNELLHLWRTKLRQSLRQGRVGKSQTLPYRYWGRRMVQPDHHNRHTCLLHRLRGHSQSMHEIRR